MLDKASTICAETARGSTAQRVQWVCHYDCDVETQRLHNCARNLDRCTRLTTAGDPASLAFPDEVPIAKNTRGIARCPEEVAMAVTSQAPPTWHEQMVGKLGGSAASGAPWREAKFRWGCGSVWIAGEWRWVTETLAMRSGAAFSAHTWLR